MRILRNGLTGVALLGLGAGVLLHGYGHASAAGSLKKSASIATVNGNFAFKPLTLKIKVGTKVTWTDSTGVAHTVTANRSSAGKPLFDKQIAGNGTVSVTFKKAGTFAYHCAIHPFMTAKVIVSK